MKTYLVSWWEQRQTVVRANSKEEAFEALGADERGDLVTTEDYECAEVISAEPSSDGIIDPDCPICQMIAQEEGITLVVVDQ